MEYWKVCGLSWSNIKNWSSKIAEMLSLSLSLKDDILVPIKIESYLGTNYWEGKTTLSFWSHLHSLWWWDSSNGYDEWTLIERVAMFSRKASKTRTSNLGNMKINSKGKEDHWCSHYKKFGHTKETCFKFHEKEKVLIRLAELKGHPPRKVYQATSNFENFGNKSFILFNWRRNVFTTCWT